MRNDRLRNQSSFEAPALNEAYLCARGVAELRGEIFRTNFDRLRGVSQSLTVEMVFSLKDIDEEARP